MNRLFFGNFDLEYQLRQPLKSAPAAVRRRNSELFSVWLAVADERDIVLSPGGVERDFETACAAAGLPAPTIAETPQFARNELEFVPWGWSAVALQRGEAMGLRIEAPPLDAVRTANSRRFSYQLEKEWQCGLPGQCCLESIEELDAALSGFAADEARWLLKSDFGMAGREQITGTGRDVNDTIRNWAKKRLRADACLFLEPLVAIESEAGLQFDLPKSGPPALLGITPLLTDSRGAYRGSRFDPDESIVEDWQEAIATGRNAVEQIQSLGYFGPVGIDVARYRNPDGHSQLRPLQDINARFTMGRLSLGLRRLLKPGEAGGWFLQQWMTDSVSSPSETFERFQADLPPDCRAVRMTPYLVEDRPVSHGMVAVIGPCWEDVRDIINSD